MGGGDRSIGSMRWALLLDLDGTLVWTNMIEHLRSQRAWSQVYRSFSLTELPPGTHDFVRKAKMLCRVGVVTTSPRAYAERLLKHHGVDLPVFVAYHDVTRRKPDPEPILKAAEKARVSLAHCICVGDLIDDIAAAVRAGGVPVGLSWDLSLKDHAGAEEARGICSNWEELLRVIVELTGEEEH